jgi:GxxExxY protein
MNTDSSKPVIRTEALKHSSTTDVIIGAFYDVYNELGQGFLESVYREALTVVLAERGLTVEQEKPVIVAFHKTTVGVFRTDLLVTTR